MLEIAEARGPKQIAKAIKALADKFSKSLRNEEDQAVAFVLDLLRKLDRDLRAEIALVDTGTFRAFHLERIQKAVETALQDFESRAAAKLSASTGEAMALRQGYFVDFQRALAAFPGGESRILPIISDQMLAAATQMNAALVRGISDELRAKVMASLQRAFIGQASPFETARALSMFVGPRGNVGAGAAADRIVRTEINRAYNLADQLFNQQIDQDRPEDLPEMLRIWVAVIDDRTRETHLKAHGQVRAIGEPFDVGGEQLEYPLDPSGSPGNTINCRCKLITVPETMVEEMLGQIEG